MNNLKNKQVAYYARSNCNIFSNTLPAGNLVRVWAETWANDQFDTMTLELAISKYGHSIRFLFENQDYNEEWIPGNYLKLEDN